MYNELVYLSIPRLSLCVALEKFDYDASTLAGKKLMSARYNNLELTTHQSGAASGKSDFHVDISKSPRGEEKILRRNEMKLRRNEMKLRKNQNAPTWKKKNIHVEI